MGTCCTLAALLVAVQAGPSDTAGRAEAVVTVSVENMYSAPDAARDVVSQATLGQVVSVLETSGAFARVRTPDAYVGWLAAAALLRYQDADAPRYARASRFGAAVVTSGSR
jgi:hypothetical protein